MSAEEEANDATPAEVIEVVGKTGMHGEAMQVKCRIQDGENPFEDATTDALQTDQLRPLQRWNRLFEKFVDRQSLLNSRERVLEYQLAIFVEGCQNLSFPHHSAGRCHHSRILGRFSDGIRCDATLARLVDYYHPAVCPNNHPVAHEAAINVALRYIERDLVSTHRNQSPQD